MLDVDRGFIMHDMFAKIFVLIILKIQSCIRQDENKIFYSITQQAGTSRLRCKCIFANSQSETNLPTQTCPWSPPYTIYLPIIKMYDPNGKNL